MVDAFYKNNLFSFVWSCCKIQRECKFENLCCALMLYLFGFLLPFSNSYCCWRSVDSPHQWDSLFSPPRIQIWTWYTLLFCPDPKYELESDNLLLTFAPSGVTFMCDRYIHVYTIIGNLINLKSHFLKRFFGFPNCIFVSKKIAS